MHLYTINTRIRTTAQSIPCLCQNYFIRFIIRISIFEVDQVGRAKNKLLTFFVIYLLSKS